MTRWSKFNRHPDLNVTKKAYFQMTWGTDTPVLALSVSRSVMDAAKFIVKWVEKNLDGSKFEPLFAKQEI